MKEILITSSVLILVLLLLRVIFAKKVSRRLIYGAWILVALRLLIPVQIGQLDFSILTSAKPVTEAITQIEQRPVSGQTKEEVYQDIVVDYMEKDQSVFVPEVQEQIKQEISQGTASKEEILDKIQQARPNQDIFVPEVQQQVQQQVADTADPITLGQIATVVWLAGVGVMAVWFLIVNLCHSRILRCNREKLDVESPIPVHVSEKVGSPCLVGLFRPAVYLTPACADEESTRRHVLTHELTHYRHRDHIWSVVRCVCLCVYWFDPLVWMAAWFSRRDCELACDEGALKRLGEEERIAYGKSLLDVVSHASRPVNLMQTATAMNETKKQLKERVNFIVKKNKISLIAGIAMILVCAIVAGCAAAGTGDGGKPGSDPERNSWDISEDEKLQIKQNYAKYMATMDVTYTVEDIELLIVSPVGDGYVLFISGKNGINFRAPWTDLVMDAVEDFEFHMPGGWWLTYCLGEDFRTIGEAYNLEWITEEQLEVVWKDYYAQFTEAWEWYQQLHTENPPQQIPTTTMTEEQRIQAMMRDYAEIVGRLDAYEQGVKFHVLTGDRQKRYSGNEAMAYCYRRLVELAELDPWLNETDWKNYMHNIECPNFDRESYVRRFQIVPDVCLQMDYTTYYAEESMGYNTQSAYVQWHYNPDGTTAYVENGVWRWHGLGHYGQLTAADLVWKYDEDGKIAYGYFGKLWEQNTILLPAYDENGRLVREELWRTKTMEWEGVIEYSYNEAGQIIRIVITQDAQHCYTTDFMYDENGKIVKEIWQTLDNTQKVLRTQSIQYLYGDFYGGNLPESAVVQASLWGQGEGTEPEAFSEELWYLQYDSKGRLQRKLIYKDVVHLGGYTVEPAPSSDYYEEKYYYGDFYSFEEYEILPLPEEFT